MSQENVERFLYVLMRRRPRIREGRLKVLEELDHLVPAPQHPRGVGPGRRQSIVDLIGERRVGGFHVARVPGAIPLLETLSERSKELGLSSRHRPPSIPRGRQRGQQIMGAQLGGVSEARVFALDPAAATLSASRAAGARCSAAPRALAGTRSPFSGMAVAPGDGPSLWSGNGSSPAPRRPDIAQIAR
jgi:hypothetical protein